MNILAVEDEEDIREVLSYNLCAEGYNVKLAESGEEAEELLKTFVPDLILLDLMLPKIGGLELCKRWRSSERLKKVLILMLTARGEEADVVLGLEAGADDYITKPFSPRVLLARLRAALRRNELEDQEREVIYAGPLEMDFARYTVKIDGEPIHATITEFRLLELLMKNPGRVYTRQQIIDHTMGEGYAVTERSVDVQIVGLRKKLMDQATCLETVRGIGYRFKEPLIDVGSNQVRTRD